MSNLTQFTFQSNQIRVLTDENNQPLFVAKDIAVVLGYARPNDALNQFCKGAVKYRTLQTKGGMQKIRVIYEPDVYRLIFGSKLESAVTFQNWVFEEVLPQIRKTGSYTQSPKSTPKFQPLIIQGKEISMRDGLFCLNDLHDLSGIGKVTKFMKSFLEARTTKGVLKAIDGTTDINQAKSIQVFEPEREQPIVYGSPAIFSFYASLLPSPALFAEILQAFTQTHTPFTPTLITDSQKEKILDAVNKRVHRTGEKHQGIYRKLHHLFGVNSYHQFKFHDFDKIMSAINGTNDSDEPLEPSFEPIAIKPVETKPAPITQPTLPFQPIGFDTSTVSGVEESLDRAEALCFALDNKQMPQTHITPLKSLLANEITSARIGINRIKKGLTTLAKPLNALQNA